VKGAGERVGITGWGRVASTSPDAVVARDPSTGVWTVEIEVAGRGWTSLQLSHPHRQSTPETWGQARMRPIKLPVVGELLPRQTWPVLTRSSGYLIPRADDVPSASKDLEMMGTRCSRTSLNLSKCDPSARMYNEFLPSTRLMCEIPPTTSSRWPVPLRDAQPQCPRPARHRNPRILRAIEPLLGEDCHVISNTAWWQPPGNNEHLGRFWHIDSGPHVPETPRSRGIRASPTDLRHRRAYLSARLPARSGPYSRHTSKPYVRTAPTVRPVGRRRPAMGRPPCTTTRGASR